MTDDQISRRIEDYSTLDNDDYLLFMQLLGAWAAIIVYLANIDFAKYISDRQSYWIALLCIALSIAITYLFTRRNNRTRIQGIFSVIIGAGIYTMYIYWNIYTAIFRNIVKIVGLAGVMLVLDVRLAAISFVLMPHTSNAVAVAQQFLPISAPRPNSS